jgi:TetR/AcrR family transcriptional regulator, regulator of autoinduction and epiphytic fitness
MSNVDEFGIPILSPAVGWSERKRDAITSAAVGEFLDRGYAGSSVDAIALRARVSKPTVYKHFGTKERLFLAVIGGALRRRYGELEPLGAKIADAIDPRAAMEEFFGAWVRIVLRDDLMRLRRLVIGEVDRFPQLGVLWAKINFEMCDAMLTAACVRLERRGVLVVPDPLLAVRQVVAMTVGTSQLVGVFHRDAVIDPAEIDATVRSGVAVFFSHYGAAPAVSHR